MIILIIGLLSFLILLIMGTMIFSFLGIFNPVIIPATNNAVKLVLLRLPFNKLFLRSYWGNKKQLYTSVIVDFLPFKDVFFKFFEEHPDTSTNDLETFIPKSNEIRVNIFKEDDAQIYFPLPPDGRGSCDLICIDPRFLIPHL